MASKDSRAFQRFLLKRGVVNEDDVKEAESLRSDMNVSLGVVALNRGLLTVDEVKRILRSHKRTKKKFGQAALLLKLLTRAQVSELLVEQEKVNLDIGELFVLTGKLSHEQLQKARRAFARVGSGSEAGVHRKGSQTRGAKSTKKRSRN
ncbi:MAG: hypothetical protein C4532_07320 [Candidatus Abyssobacteria bacterium SURF_17]|uniref:Type II secretion system protein GspE N-terminal domain-containing protein n=1 Tax=Candidatus Abyssobacteria bacterium SURF_17 TaxID=2093361 RepID=A0A419F1E9_9BACT|nr:MAG: hypothetical protein C4532_07320 [Candidatus Abyssubacteria bacterium SURF_17]